LQALFFVISFVPPADQRTLLVGWGLFIQEREHS
jgi:hypothetical protein